MRTSIKRFAIIGTTLLTFSGAGVAFAAWTASGTGSAYTKAATAQALSTVDISATVVGTLYPGGSGNVEIEILNPNPYPVTVTNINGNGAITGAGGIGTCTLHGVTYTNQVGTWAVPASTSVAFTLTAAATMANAAEDGCQGATFTIPVTMSGTSG